MGLSVDVTAETFETAVLEPSFQKPVLIDFFAQWCGPCKMLKPVLEKLALEYDFVLAKVDIDQNPELAGTYQVEGVPDVRVVMQGQVGKGFVGVLTEAQIRDFLERLHLKSDLTTGLEQLEQAPDPAAAGQILDNLLQRFPGSPALALAAAQHYIQQDQIDSARSFLAQIAHDREYGDQVEGLQGLLELKQGMLTETTSALDQTYQTACKAAVAGDYEGALEKFLTLVERDRTYRKDGGRKAMITVFKLLGDDHPLTMTYRKRLMQAMY